MFFTVDLEESDGSAVEVHVNSNQVARVTTEHDGTGRVYSFFSAQGDYLGMKEILASDDDGEALIRRIFSHG
jgi:hypothetical protein